ncbi:hypothetical protein K0504_09975 [Neiella marina]|uniref:Uncharacterized protein n=1 Tax=Neiella holothuriorum TaxID=2870530 RepID=A0ABS7EGB5_9GAMM|nr:hypothetical protein [Neiella holothuriorum]MBW8191365.1 hypothetical protein [Neiella holothuriorum]
MTFQTFQPDQIALVSAIVQELSRQQPDLPAEAALMNKVIEAANMICDECARERIYANKAMTPAEWLASDDVGESSRYMLACLANIGCPPDNGPRPLAASDLGRCIRMLRACDLENKIELMRDRGKRWSELVEHWKPLVRAYDEEDYEKVSELLNPSN